MKNILIKKTYETIEEFNASPEFISAWEGFCIRYEKNHTDIKFVKAFIAENDKIYILREIIEGKESGLRLLNEFSIYSCLNNRNFKAGFISSFDNSIWYDEEKQYDRCNQNRIAFAKHNKTIPDTLAFVTTCF